MNAVVVTGGAKGKKKALHVQLEMGSRGSFCFKLVCAGVLDQYIGFELIIIAIAVLIIREVCRF